MLPRPEQPTLATHWGTYRVEMDASGPARLAGIGADPDPSRIADAMIAARTGEARILRPAIRRSFLEHGPRPGAGGRGAEPFVEVEWDVALDIVARELDRVRKTRGNRAIYAGSYGWASAGRFHHAQSQIHRFLNTIGGYTRSVQNYSFAAADTILPHVVGDRRGLASGHTPWRLIAGHADLLVMFGGVGQKNAQVASGGVGRHTVRAGLEACRDAGAGFVSISPIRDDTLAATGAEWLSPRPNTDTALMLGLAHVLLAEGLADRAFLDRYTTGFARLEAYVTGAADGVPKTPEWAAAISDVPAEALRTLARRMAAGRTMIMMSWSLQRADHGEQPYWMAVALAAMLGQIGLPGGGFGFGYGSVNGIGSASYDFAWPSLAQGTNGVADYIPVARIADMLLNPGKPYDFNGERRRYPEIDLVYWAGGNPFHHHQDLNRLVEAWQKPGVVVVHDAFWNATCRHADVVLPVTVQLERNDIVAAARDTMIAASHRLAEPAGEARDDFWIFSELAARLGVAETFTEGRDEESWLRHLYGIARQRTAEAGLETPDFDRFWKSGVTLLPEPDEVKPLLAAFRADPDAHPLATPSGRIEIFSEKIAGFGYPDCPGHPSWLASEEWLGAPAAATYPLHLLSNQPVTKLHSQYDSGAHARAAKIAGREPLRMHPEAAAARGLKAGDIVRVYNDRGACLAGLVLCDGLRPDIVQLSTGAWYDPAEPGGLDKHGNPNVLTHDRGTSRLAQGPAAQSCLVEIERFDGPPPEITAYAPPPFVPPLTRPRG